MRNAVHDIAFIVRDRPAMLAHRPDRLRLSLVADVDLFRSDAANARSGLSCEF
jgi:hypothetical protein